MADLVAGLQVPDSMHVQVSYFCSNSWGECGGPLSAERDGAALDALWVESDVSFNGGSGIEGYHAHQFCDCGVEPGKHEYKLQFGDDHPGYAWPEVTVEVVDPPPSPREPEPMPEGDVLPWDIPDGPWPKGLDCVQWCLENPPVDPVEPGLVEPGPVEPAQADGGATTTDSGASEEVVAGPSEEVVAGPSEELAGPSEELAAPQPDGGSSGSGTGWVNESDGSCSASSTSPPLLALALLTLLAGLLLGLRTHILVRRK